MKFNRSLFIDSSNLEEVKKWNATGIIDGVTTNQSIMLNDGLLPNEIDKIVKKICLEMKTKPVSVELTDSTTSSKEMIKEAKKYAAIAPNIVVKVPLIPNTTKSLEVINSLIKLNIAVNVTTMMTYEQMIQAILATRGSKKICFVSLFWGRSLEDHEKYRSNVEFMKSFPKVGSKSDINNHPKNIVDESSKFIKEGGYENVKIIVGSIRNATMVGDAFASGGHIVTVVPDVLNAMLFSQRTVETIDQFDKAWRDLNAKKFK